MAQLTPCSAWTVEATNLSKPYGFNHFIMLHHEPTGIGEHGARVNKTMTNAPTINAIPTTYKRVTFRSRTEARWAYFFDQVGISWDYEAEGYELPGGQRYLPDFWFPQLDCFFEVKGTTDFDDEKVSQGAAASGKRIFVATGGPICIGRFYGIKDNNHTNEALEAFFPPDNHMPDGGWDNYHTFGICSHGRIGIEFEGDRQIYRHCAFRDYHDGSPLAPSRGDLTDNEFFASAIHAAMAYRFWDPVVRS